MKKKLRVVIRIDSGMVSVIRRPKDVELEVRDYDIDGLEGNGQDKDGKQFERTVYHHC